MNPLKVNPETGFLETNTPSGYGFDSARKLQFLALADEHFTKTGNMPDLTSMAQAIGIHPHTVDAHMRDDAAFALAWRNIKLKGKWKLEGKMYEYAQGKGGYMHMITWLRKEFPEEYNPDIRVINSTDNGLVKRLSDVFNAEIVTPDPEIKAITSTPPAIDGPQ